MSIDGTLIILKTILMEESNNNLKEMTANLNPAALISYQVLCWERLWVSVYSTVNWGP